MKQNSTYKRFPCLYRQDVLEWRRQTLGLSKLKIAKRANLNRETTRKVFKGMASNAKVYPVAKVLGLDWSQVHNLDLQTSDFHLALRNGQVKGRAAVGGERP